LDRNHIQVNVLSSTDQRFFKNGLPGIWLRAPHA
jgi:hypothetical protein